jgi:inner membrane protein
MQSPAPSLVTAFRHSNVVRVLMLFVLVILFQIPIFALDGLIRERQGRRDTAVEEVASKWGRQQSVIGPMLIVPYTTTWTEVTAAGPVVRQSQHLATFLPERLSTRGTLDAERRRRGIFSTSVYRANLHVEGVFARPSFTAWGVDSKDVQWSRAQLVIGISDNRAIESTAAMHWNGASAEVLPGTTEGAVVTSGVHAEAAVPEGAQSIPFSIDLPLKGSGGAYWVPMGKTTDVAVRSNWASPSFQGGWLPERRSLGPKGFEAQWTIAYLGRNFPQAWKDAAVTKETLDSARFGFDLIETTDHYQMATRSVKYAGLFLLLTFATLWLVEVLARVSVHPIQYLLIGSAMCVFYLLELSLSEHLGFGFAYIVATVAIVAQIAGYCTAVLHSRRRAAIVGGVSAVLFGYLYVVLTNEDYALLIGSIGVFAILAVIMYLTRRVDWYGTQPAT